MQSIDRLADILHSNFFALNHVYNVVSLASEACTCLVYSSCAMTSETVSLHDVRARLAAPSPTVLQVKLALVLYILPVQ